MSGSATLLILVAAAVLEAIGDAIVRSGLNASDSGAKASLLLLGGIVLMFYGVVVNLPPWDFGRLLGAYVTLFFVAAQAIGDLRALNLSSPYGETSRRPSPDGWLGSLRDAFRGSVWREAKLL